ncbi:MAG: citrate/2-methylcitrate synthase [Clostridia bacterium]
MYTYSEHEEYINNQADKFSNQNSINPELFKKYKVKKGLRNEDGTGVVAGLTQICNVHGYLVNEGERMPVDGELIYRGINVKDIINGCNEENRFGFEETTYLLLFGKLPTKNELEEFTGIISESRNLPGDFVEDMILNAPSKDIMNSMSRSVLGLYCYDDKADILSVQNQIRQSLQLIARFPSLAVNAYQVKRRYFDNESLFFHFPSDRLSTAENFLMTLRPDKKFTHEEARILDTFLVLHAEHGGGNNSTFTTRVLSSSGTDIYSAISGALGSLKGGKHGGANTKVVQMFEHIKNDVEDINSDEQVALYIEKILQKKVADKSGLVYGMGHAIYTASDPRAIILKECARKLAVLNNTSEEFELIDRVERLTPGIFNALRGENKVFSANVDMYSGFVLKMLKIPQELFTPLFAISRVSGWCAHRLEEITTNNKIIRPAYKAISKSKGYVKMTDR